MHYKIHPSKGKPWNTILLDSWLYHGYTIVMKTAISLPDQLYKQAENAAKLLGIPRSQLVAKALQEFITRHIQDNITEDLNKVYSSQQHKPFNSTIEDASIESIRELTKNDAW